MTQERNRPAIDHADLKKKKKTKKKKIKNWKRNHSHRILSLFFSEKTGKSLVTTKPLTEPFFIAVGLDTDGDNVTDDIRKSAGPNIQPDNFVYLTRDEYKASQNQVIQITDLKLFCGNSGGVKIELENSQTQFVLGNTAYRKTLIAKTVDCDKCGADGCVPADTAKFVQDLLLIAKLENEDFFKIEAIDENI